jgi:polyhydroxyalkanoate synthesis repressor PhaR
MTCVVPSDRLGLRLRLRFFAARPMPASRRSSPAAEGEAPAATPAQPLGKLRVLKKYPNRRLYDTRTSSYITLTDVKGMVLTAEPFEVRDAKTGEDITRSILLQIILEEESGGVPMFSTETLAQIIRLYGHTMQGMMGTLLERNMRAFSELQGRLLGQSGQAPIVQEWMGSYFEQSRSLMEQWQRNAGALFTAMPGFGPPKK